MKKTLILMITVSVFALAGYGCDAGGTVCTDNTVGVVAGTASTKLYYPCSLSSPVGATTMSSGYTGTLTAVDWLSQRVAEAGYVVLAFTPDNTFGLVSTWRDAHKNCIEKLKEINNTHVNLRGMIDTSKLSTCGHSKGGGGSLWASAQLGRTLKTTVAMAPYREGFQNSQLVSISAPTFIQAGAADTLATNAMTRGEYEGLSGALSRKYVEYTGYSHMAWASATGTQADRLAEDIVAWMKYYLDGDTAQRSIIADESGTTMFDWVDMGSGGNW